MRRTAATAGLALATALSGLPAYAQSNAAPFNQPLSAARPAVRLVLRGSQDLDADPGVALPPSQLGLPPQQLGLAKPDAVQRIGAGQTLEPLLTLPDQERSPLLSGDPTAPGRAAAAFGSPVLLRGTTAVRRRTGTDADPYAPTGVEIGSLTVVPSVELDNGYSSNPDRVSGSHKGSGFTTLAPHIEVSSDWSRNALRGSLDGSVTRYWSDDTIRPRLAAVVDGRYDVSSQTSLNAELRGNLDTELTSLDSATTSNDQRKLTAAYGVSLGASQRVGDLVGSLQGSLDRNDYQIQSGTRDYTTPGVTARLSYDSGAPVTPFVEASLDRRIHDRSIASDGTRRNSTGLTGDAGVNVAITGTLSGEAAVGYGTRNYEDGSLGTLSGALARASLVWTPTGLTTIGLRASTDFNETVQAGSPGAVARTVGVDIAHALRRNLIATASLAATFADYSGLDRQDDTTQGTLGLEYRLTPTAAVRASYAYERVDSNVAGIDTRDNTVFLGLKVQR